MCLRLLFSYQTHLKIVLVLTLLDNISVIKTPSQLYLDIFLHDIVSCPNCFNNQYEKCVELYEIIEESKGFYEQLFSSLQIFDKKRHFQWLQIKQTNVKVIAKTYLIKEEKRLSQNVSILTNEFRGSFPTLGGFNYCTMNSDVLNDSSLSALRIVSYFKARGYSERAILLYMLENVTPLVMPEMALLELPVPHVYAACGFSVFQANAGHTLSYYGKAEFHTRLKISKLLIKLALQFTYGFDNFRIYLTDLTADNLAYDEATQKLTLIDLDTIIIVDAAKIKVQDIQSSIQRYEIIQSTNGFAYDPLEFCKSNLYDINIYSACYLLNEVLLRSLPVAVLKEYPNFRSLLAECVTCPEKVCKERFQTVGKLLELIDKTLAAQISLFS